MQIRVKKAVKKVVVGEYGALVLSASNPEKDARAKAHELRARLKAGERMLLRQEKTSQKSRKQR